MEEPFFAPDVADGRLGDDDALETGGDIAAGFGDRADASHAQQVAQRNDADQLSVVDDGEVPVVMRRQAVPRRVDFLVWSEDIGSRVIHRCTASRW